MVGKQLSTKQELHLFTIDPPWPIAFHGDLSALQPCTCYSTITWSLCMFVDNAWLHSY
jgi:hypothetical protein